MLTIVCSQVAYKWRRWPRLRYIWYCTSQIATTALVVSSTTRLCINKEFVTCTNLETKKLPIKLPVYNADGTLNERGSIEEFTTVRLVVGNNAEWVEMAVTNLRKTDIFLSLDWLRYHNPRVDWSEFTVVFDGCLSKCRYLPVYKTLEDDDEKLKRDDLDLEPRDQLFYMNWDSYINVRSHQTLNSSKEYLNEYPDVFSQRDFDQLPEQRPWDHAIELTLEAKSVDYTIGVPVLSKHSRSWSYFFKHY